ncbi:MAG: PGPGW domain-containing protein [Actinomycetota bacterium]
MAGSLHKPGEWVRLIISNVRRLTVLLVGVAVMGAGFAMLVLPGPGILIVVIGLAILAREFAWAERTLDKTRARATDATMKLTGNPLGKLVFAASAAALIAGGGVAIILVDGFAPVGAGLVFAGVCALAVLLPRTRKWMTSSTGHHPGQ